MFKIHTNCNIHIMSNLLVQYNMCIIHNIILDILDFRTYEGIPNILYTNFGILSAPPY